MCKLEGINIDTWNFISRGLRRPSNAFIREISKYLGDGIELLFLNHYIDNDIPKFITADKYIPEMITRERLNKYRIDILNNRELVYG